MKKAVKIFKVVIPVLFLLLLVMFIVGIRITFRSADSELKTFLTENKLDGSVGYFDHNDDQLRYLRTGAENMEVVFLFIHGAPGSLEMFYSYLKDDDLLNHGMVVSIDRPGYGYANYGNAQTSIQAQGEIISEFIKSTFPDKKIIITGHSFGAPIAAFAAYLAPDQVKALILAAGAVDPESEKFEFLAEFTNTKLIRSLASEDTRVATMEKLTHREELKKIMPIWGELDMNIIAIHGDRDQLVPYENVNFLIDCVQAGNLTVETLENKGHLFVLRKNILVEKLIQIKKKIR